MKKKLNQSIPFLLILVFTGWFSYKFFIERKAPPEQSLALDWDELDSTTTSPPEKTPVTLKTVDGASHMREHNTLTKEDVDQFAVFDKMEKSWLAVAETIIGKVNYPRYLEMRESNEKEKMMAYQEYHDYLRQQFGDKFEYNISEDQSIREKDINKRYLKDLLTLIGNKKFQAYVEARDKINEENHRKDKSFIQIEF